MSNSTKDYIINLRVSKETYKKIKERSCKNRNTVSGLIRTIINDSIDTVNDISSELLGAEKDGVDADIVSYQRGTLAQDRKCDCCKSDMKTTDLVSIGETTTNSRRYFCNACKPSM